ncbi:Trp biosynthesis-associated membrane protein [Nocardioides zeicaulis]|uniref:Trp biosynthesis-associated membrane protein n=1 Tax=Nocardioides zeicaulis TaxID=1776857 RepID=A0ABV6E741_9ACTN
MAEQETPAPRRPRSTFGPVVLLGLVAAGTAATAANKPWASGSSGRIDTAQGEEMNAMLSLDGVRDSPLAGALALVVLACWGVLLVTRGRFRRAVAVLGLVAALGTVVVTAEGARSVPDKLSGALMDASGRDTAAVSLTGWYAAALVGAVVSVLATAAAARFVGSWPEMGARYDSPAGASAAGGSAGGAAAGAGAGAGEAGSGEVPRENIDIWKALDEGRDPTA